MPRDPPSRFVVTLAGNIRSTNRPAGHTMMEVHGFLNFDWFLP